MNFLVHSQTPHSLVLEDAACCVRLELCRDSRWNATIRFLFRADRTEAWAVRGAGDLYGVLEPFDAVRPALLDLERWNSVPSDVGGLNAHLSKLLRDLGLRGGTFDERMHYGHVLAFLGAEDPVALPSEVRALAERYAEDLAEYQAKRTRDYYVADLDFERDWVYKIAIDLVRRQSEPTSSICVLVAAEPLDDEFSLGFYAFRDNLDGISGDYVHFFALSNLNGGPSKTGKDQLLKSLRSAGIDLTGNQAFLVFIRLRSLSNPGIFEADVIGTYEFSKHLKAAEVAPILTKVAKIARQSKRDGDSLDEFVNKARQVIAWKEGIQRVKQLEPLLRLIERAIKFIP